MKDAMIFIAKVQKKQNIQMCEELKKLTEEQRKKVYPELGMNGSNLHTAMAGMVGNGVFTLPMMGISSASEETVKEFVGGMEKMPDGSEMLACKSYDDVSFDDLAEDVVKMNDIYIKVFEECTDEELVNPNEMGLPPFDFCMKGILGGFNTRAQMSYILKNEGLADVPLLDGPLAD